MSPTSSISQVVAVGGTSGKGQRTSPPRSPSKYRNKTPCKWRRRTPGRISGTKKEEKAVRNNSNNKEVKSVKGVSEQMARDSESGDDDSFTDHSDLCERMAKTFYFANKLPSTPRPSLPLTMLAVNTFASTARKDTLEFLDVEMAAEIGRNACVSPTALIMALIYLERLSGHNPGYLNSIKPSELFVVSLLVASKFMQDDGEDLGIFNDEWATSAHMELKSLNRLELEFLTAIDWRVNVSKDEYDKILQRLEAKLALDQGIRRGWFTYTELGNLSNTLLSWNLIWPTLYEHCVKVITAAYMIYATLLATLLTSSLLAPHIFLLSKGFFTASIGSLSSMNSISSSCSYSGFANSTSSKLPISWKSRSVNPEEMSRLIEAEDLILGDENETDTSFLRDIQESHYLLQGASADTKWKNRMSVNSRIDLQLLNRKYRSETKQENELCHQEWNEPPVIGNDEEAFAHYLKHFFELNSKIGLKSNVGEKLQRNGLNFQRSAMKCYQDLNVNNFRLPLGSVVKV